LKSTSGTAVDAQLPTLAAYLRSRRAVLQHQQSSRSPYLLRDV